MHFIKNRSIELIQQLEHPLGDFACKIVDAGSYIETIEFKSISAFPGYVDLVIETQQTNSRFPNEKRVKSRTCVDLEKIKELHTVLGRFLKANPI
jgi:hypothetical protein